jgi:hypothetical protein
MFTNRKKSWYALQKSYKEVIEVWPDPGIDTTGFRIIRTMRTYNQYNRQFKPDNVIHLQCTMESGTTHVITVKEMLME